MQIHSFTSGWMRKFSVPMATVVIVGLLAVQQAQASSEAVAYTSPNRSSYYDAAPIAFLAFGAIFLFAGIMAFHNQPTYHRVVPVHYVVVRKPATVIVQKPPVEPDTVVPTPAQPETKTVMVKNSNGSRTPVVLELVNGEWKGPRGEFYDTFPTEEQLHSAYGF